MLKVNHQKSAEIGLLLRDLEIHPDFYDREFLRFKADRETKLKVYLFSAAICHQTHNLHFKEKNLWGWEYLEYGFLQMVKENSPLLDPRYICSSTVPEIEQLLQKVFSSDGNPKNSSLDRITERVEMLVEICKVLKTDFNYSVVNLIDYCSGRLIDDGIGLYELLSRFNGFSDPLKKKISFFIKLATDSRVLQIIDPHNIIPIMDYHMQRVLLRMGCVDMDDKMIKTLQSRQPLFSDEAIRKGCIDAIRIISEKSGQPILTMNDYFWPLGRSCCNETTLCSAKKCIKSPCTFFQMVNLADHLHCPFEQACKGFKDEVFRELWEPVVETHFY